MLYETIVTVNIPDGRSVMNAQTIDIN